MVDGEDQDTEPVSPVAAVLRRMVEMRRQMDQLEYDVIALVRSTGATWEEIADELGISRQATYQRFGKLRRRQAPK